MLILSCYALCVCIFIHIDMYVYAKYFGNTTSNSVYNMRFYYYTYYTVKKVKDIMETQGFTRPATRDKNCPPGTEYDLRDLMTNK